MTKRDIQRVVFGLTAACSWAIGAPALADHHKEKAEAQFKMMDTSADGRLSQEEHAAGARKMFETMDTNKDARVTAAEMDAARALMHGKAGTDDKGEAKAEKDPGHAKMSSADKIKVVDTDGDGVLTATEHSAGATKKFNQMDTDRDGQLTRDEVKAGHRKMMTPPKEPGAQ